MTKKTKFATALLATALLANGFNLDTKEEVSTPDPEPTTEVVTDKEIKTTIEPQHLVAEQEVQVEFFDETPIMEEKEALAVLPTETEPQPTETLPQATTLTQTQADTGEPVPTIPQTQQVTATREPTINIPEPDSMNGIDYGTSQTIQPDVPSKPVYSEEQMTDPTQTPDGTPVEVYVQEVTPQIASTEENSSDLAYVPGFGWVPIPDPCEVIFAEDMFTNGNKVGTMGGG